MPEVGGKYLNAKVMLPRGDSYAEGQMILTKPDAAGNVKY